MIGLPVKTNPAGRTVSVAEPLKNPSVAVMVTVPGAIARAVPALVISLLICATVGSDELHVAKASSDQKLDAAFAAIAQSGAAVLIEGSDPLFIDRRKHIVALTISNKIPAIFFERDSVLDGGLMTYSASIADSFRQVGVYVGRILKGDKPSDLPVQQSTRIEMVL